MRLVTNVFVQILVVYLCVCQGTHTGALTCECGGLPMSCSRPVPIGLPASDTSSDLPVTTSPAPQFQVCTMIGVHRCVLRDEFRFSYWKAFCQLSHLPSLLCGFKTIFYQTFTVTIDNHLSMEFKDSRSTQLPVRNPQGTLSLLNYGRFQPHTFK